MFLKRSNLFVLRWQYFRCATKRNYSVKPQKRMPKDLAMDHFDEFYGPLFGQQWPSIRLGLLCRHKYCAVINPFSGIDDLLQSVTSMGAKSLSAIYNQRLKKMLHGEKPLGEAADNDELGDEQDELEESDEDKKTTRDSRSTVDMFIPVSEMWYQEEVVTESEYHQFYRGESLKHNAEEELIPFPSKWKVVIFPRGDISLFPQPPKDATGLLAYYLLDASSLLPVWALNISPGNDVADFCAAPGGKSLAAMFTFCPRSIFCNDSSLSRLNRLKRVFDSYLPTVGPFKVALSQKDASLIDEPDRFDRILVDVPCSNDRISSTTDENSLFKPSRLKERVTMPQIQSQLLFAAMKSLRTGGSIVYSTCSLSPIQNDGVVHVTLKKIWEETSMEFVIKDLKKTFKPLKGVFRFDYSCKYGLLVLPYLPSNFGPLYFSKITRTK